MKGRAGSTLIELMFTLMALAIIGIACAGLVRSQSVLLRTGSERAAVHETLRAARTILRAELQDATAGDRRAIASDSIALRVFRGFGIVCSANQTRRTLRYQGVRQPDAAKDSLLFAPSKRTGTIRQISSRTDPCMLRPGEQLVAIEPDSALPIGSLVLFFESGAYQLSANALRYRRGSSGAQPITDDMIDHTRSRFALSQSSRSINVTLRSTSTAISTAQQVDTRIGVRNQ